MPDNILNSYCRFCPHGVRRASTAHRNDFIFHGQVQLTVSPFELTGKPPQGQHHSCWVFIKGPQKPPLQALTPSLQGEGIFVVFTAHPQDSKCFHTVLNLQENKRLIVNHRTQPLQYTLTQISPQLHLHNPEKTLTA